MKLLRNIPFTFLLFIAVLLPAQEQGLPDGLTVFYHPNGEKSSEGYISNGKPEGYWKTYSENGVLLSPPQLRRRAIRRRPGRTQHQ